jgi:hypothetical protein
MRRRNTWALLVILAVAAGTTTAFGLPWSEANHGWRRVPHVTLVSPAGDPRLSVAEEAVNFWNRTFAELRTSFRLGPIDRVVGEIPDADLQALSTATRGISFSAEALRGAWLRQHPAPFDRLPGDLLVVLSDAKFISFSSRAGDRHLVAIKGAQFMPLTLPNVLRNVIAHELGHTMGLEHNSDPTTLMCGRPAPCRPDVFASDTPKFFPLTTAERERLRGWYPPTWAP